jgi:hypothetical protein
MKFLHVGRDHDWSDVLEVDDAMRLAPSEELTDGLGVGRASVPITDVGREELDEPPRSPLVRARPDPMAWMDSETALTTPTVAFVTDWTRLACKLSPAIQSIRRPVRFAVITFRFISTTMISVAQNGQHFMRESLSSGSRSHRVATGQRRQQGSAPHRGPSSRHSRTRTQG